VSAAPQNPIVMIPARLAARRLPNKPLADIAGSPMIVHVWRRAVAAGIGPVVVACGDHEIVAVIEREGGRAVMTDPELPTGSDRIHAAISALDPGQAHDAVITATNQMAKNMLDCAQKTVVINEAKKNAPPPVYDPVSAITESVNFYITATGSITPTWKLVRVTAPISGTFISGIRKDTNTLILTMGRPQSGAGGIEASTAMNNQILYSILSQSGITVRP